jgi:hypothetical protein
MTTLTYRYLGDLVQVGQPLGCDPTGWPYQVVKVVHIAREDDPELASTAIGLEPWPIPRPDAGEVEKAEYTAAMQHARDRMAGRLAP